MKDIEQLRQQLQESQAREVKFREALHTISLNWSDEGGADACNEALNEAFALPSDDTALRELIAGVYEECAKVCETAEIPIDIDVWMGTKKALTAATAIGLASAIRALAEKAKGE